VAAALGAAPEAEEEAVVVGTAAAVSDPWTGLLQAGMALLQQVTGAARNGSAGSPRPEAGQAAGAIQSLVKRDDKTGETYLKLPVPAPEVLDQALRAVGALLESLRK
jgi:hypothetical protein